MTTTSAAAFDSDDSMYINQAPFEDEEELGRLDEMHVGFRDFFGNELSLVSVGEPKQILELGAGSGAWAIQAAQKYPEAEVIAVDISPLPNRRLPPNVKYENLNLKDDLPFEPRSFDVVHIRFVLIHMPNYTNLMHRAIDLVKPGGWFLLEDCDHMLYESTGTGQGTRTLFDVLNNDHFKANGCDPYLGPTLERRLKETNLFSKVNAVEINCPVSPGPISDPKLRVIGRNMRSSLAKAYPSISIKFPALTNEILRAWLEEFNDPNKSYTFNMYALSAQKI